MITFSKLGNWGRLGNQMFQYAMLYNVAKKNNYELWYPHDYYENGIMLTECFSGVVKNDKGPDTLGPVYKETGWEYNPDVFEQPDGTEFFGYFQNPMYFAGVEDDIRKQFSFHPEILKHGDDLLTKLPKDKTIVSLHIRRTDYLHLNALYTFLDMGYYGACLDKHDPATTLVLVFTDDPNWCIYNLKLNHKFVVVDTRDRGSIGPYIELYMMTKCDVNIMANSSFSWWGSWLNDDSEVYAPKKWFNPKTKPNVSYEGFFPKEWNLI